MHHLLQENYYLRQRVAELERENQHIRLMLAAKTLIIDKIEFNFDKIKIDNLSGSLQIGLAHQAESLNPQSIHLPDLQKGPRFRI
jgi:hypothetical protein